MNTLYLLADSVIRILLTIVFFYVFKHFFAVENDSVLTFISIVSAFALFQILVILFNKSKTKK